MKRLLAKVCTLFVAAGASAIHAEPTWTTVEMNWDVTVAADGHVTEISTSDENVPNVYADLERMIRTWRFNPGKVDGVPARTQTHLHTGLEVRIVDDRVEMRVLRVTTGGRIGKMVVPAYPVPAAQRGKQGLVMLRVRYDEAGVPRNVERYGEDNSTDKLIVRAAISNVRQWTFHPEIVGGHPLAGDIALSLCFHLENLPAVDCNLKNPETGEVVIGSDALALKPVATLESNVIGRVL